MTYLELWELVARVQGDMDSAAENAANAAEDTPGELGAYQAGFADGAKLAVRLLAAPVVDGESEDG